MAGIDRERWQVLDPLLDRALELRPDERAGWLDALRVHSPTLAADLGTLLAEEVDADRRGFLVEPLPNALGASPGTLGTPIPSPLVTPRAGFALGGYAIERALGRGGMGAVWLARRVDGRFEGHVAVKFLHHALLGDAGQERFRREGAMLARLAHPNIARLLDAGVVSGQPYLVLEYVDGERIDAFADTRRLPPAERLRLVLQVLAAVGHAHARLIIHRDLKPSNILVTDSDDTGAGAGGGATAKLLDFGIAKLLDADGKEERTALTVDGGRVLTPEFAAPEQLRGEPVTTATDVYAVGVLLYALLTGRHPFDLAGRSAAEIERIVTTVTPPKPSSTFAEGASSDEDRRERAHLRGGTPDRLRRELRGDLDAIVMKALHQEPERRYASASAFADDVARLLDGRPVVARPDSTGYRMRRFVGRHRGGVAIAAAVATLLVGAALREGTLRARAEVEARKAHAVEDYLVSVFDVADPYASPDHGGGEVTARALLDRGAARIDSALAGQADVQADLRGVLGRVYSNLGLFDRSAPLLQRALDQQRAVHGPRHPAVAEAMDRLGDVLAKQNEFDRAEPLLREALAQRRALLGDVSAPTAVSLDHLATLLQDRNKLDQAELLFREAVDVRRAVYGPDHEEVASSLNNLGLLLVVKGVYAQAEPLFRSALAIARRRLGEDHPLTSQTLHNLASDAQYQGRYEEAATLYRRALAAKRRTLGDAHPSVTVNMNNLGVMLAVDMGQLDEAEQLIRQALALDRRMFGDHHAYVAEGQRNLALVLRLRGDFDESERILRSTLALNRSLFGAEHPRVALNLYHLAQTRQLKGDLPNAIVLYRQALAQYAHLVGAQHLSYTTVSLNLARALEESGDPVAAEEMLRAAATRLDTASRGQRVQVVTTQVGLGRALLAQGRAAEALPVLDRALAMSRARFGDDHWRTAEARLFLGECLMATGRAARAAPLLRAADATLQQQRRAQPRLAARAHAALQRVASEQSPE